MFDGEYQVRKDYEPCNGSDRDDSDQKGLRWLDIFFMAAGSERSDDD